MTAKERKQQFEWESYMLECRVRSVMNSHVPTDCQEVRRMFDLSTIQKPQSTGSISSETVNAIVVALSEALEKSLALDKENSVLIKDLTAELKQLRTLLDKETTPPIATSENSGIPSSKNPISEQERIKKKTKSLRKRSDKPVGGQVGHKGSTLKKRETVDNRIQIYPDSPTCPNCGALIPHSLFTEGETRQIIDLCNNIIETTEKVSMVAQCPICGTKVKGQFGELEGGNINYGVNL